AATPARPAEMAPQARSPEAKASPAKAPESEPVETDAAAGSEPGERRWQAEPAAAPSKLRPVEPAAQGRRPGGFAPANDDRRKDYRSLLQSLNHPAPQTVIWITGLISVLWLVGGGFALQALFGSEIWQPSNFVESLSDPAVVGTLACIVLPVILFFAFGAMIRRAQEMRLAAQSMTEIAFRLAEPENLAAD